MNTENLTGISKILMNAACAVSKLSQESPAPLDADKIYETLSLFKDSLLEEQAYVVEKRPEILACDVVRFQNNKDKWVAFVGLLNGHPYEIFTGLQDDDEGILLPKTVTKGNIIKVVNPDGTKRYDFQFENKRGYKTTVEGLSEKFKTHFGSTALPYAFTKRHKARKFAFIGERKHQHVEKRCGTCIEKISARRKSGII